MNTDQKISKKEVQSDVGRLKSITALVNLPGGKLLVKALKRDVEANLESVLSLYKGPEIELRAAVISLKTNLTMLRTLLKSKKMLKMAIEVLAELAENDESDEE